MSDARGLGSRRGYALPAALVALSIVAIALSGVIPALGDLTRNAHDTRAQARIALQAADAEAWAVYVAATAQVTQDRLRGAPDTQGAEIRLDGRPYAWRGLSLRLQDESGLLDLNSVDDRTLRRLFIHAGASAAKAEILANQLLDHRDPDALRRPFGAESPDDGGLLGHPMPNEALSDPLQLLGLAAWPGAGASWPAIADLVTARPDRSDLNLDTAPRSVLEIGLGFTPRASKAVIDHRQIQPYYGAVRAVTDSAPTLARLRLTTRDPSSGRGVQTTFILTPRAAERPFVILRAHADKQPEPSPHVQFPALAR